MRASKKAWKHVGYFTRQEAVDLLSERLVSQKRRVSMKDSIRIIYYCHVQRSSGCRYEMSVCVPNDPEEKIRIDDFNVHTCNPEDTRLRRRAKPRIEDFSKPIIERRRTPMVPNGRREDAAIPYPFNDSMTHFLNGLNDHFEVENDLEIADQDEYGMGPNENLAKFISEFDESAKPSTSGQPSSPNVWSTVDVEIVDFSKRPDPPFTYIFHAKDEVSQYTYACPLINNQPEVVADALSNLLFLFGAPKTIKLDCCYRGFLEKVVAEKFPSTQLVFYAENKNKQGVVAPRREETMIRERIYAWLMENGKLNWSKYLSEIKYMHNSEWIEELGGTPLDLFFGRSRRLENNRKRKAEGAVQDDDTLSDSFTNNSNEVKDESSSLYSVEVLKKQQHSNGYPAMKSPKCEE
uniref:DDE_Tnp_1_7 domain-containing protein n=2 Tax=Haemonchus contortus TaxID=6289 RepID=A0A7I4XTH2_HAECO